MKCYLQDSYTDAISSGIVGETGMPWENCPPPFGKPNFFDTSDDLSRVRFEPRRQESLWSNNRCVRSFNKVPKEIVVIIYLIKTTTRTYGVFFALLFLSKFFRYNFIFGNYLINIYFIFKLTLKHQTFWILYLMFYIIHVL